MSLHFTQQDLIYMLVNTITFLIAVMCENSRAPTGDQE